MERINVSSHSIFEDVQDLLKNLFKRLITMVRTRYRSSLEKSHNHSIEILSDDAIIHILSFIENIRERRRLGMVSKRWQVLSNISLRCEKEISKIEQIYYKRELKENIYGLLKEKPRLCKVLSICPNVKIVDTRCLDLLDLRLEKKHARDKPYKLIRLIVKDNLNNLSDRDLVWLLKKSPELKELSIYLFRRFTGTCLKYLGDYVEKLELINNDELKTPQFENIIMKKFKLFFKTKGKNIRSFKEEAFSYILNDLFNNCADINTLEISGYFSAYGNLSHISCLGNLTVLEIDESKNFFTYEKLCDLSLVHLLKSCPNLLKFSLNSGENFRITDRSIIELANNCRKLLKVTLKSVKISQESFHKLSCLPELTEISIEDCEDMGNGYMHFFRRSKKLRNIKLIRCGIIKEDLIAEINKIDIHIRVFNPFDSKEVYYINY